MVYYQWRLVCDGKPVARPPPLRPPPPIPLTDPVTGFADPDLLPSLEDYLRDDLNYGIQPRQLGIPSVPLREEEEEDVVQGAPPAPPPPPPPPLVDYSFTPKYSKAGLSSYDCINYQTSLAVSKGFRHDPDGIPWLSPSLWAASTWDGVTTWNPDVLTKSQLYNGIWPQNVNVMRGLRELFYTVNPFADNLAPTVLEIENWNRRVIKHYRDLMGVTVSITNDRRLYQESQWATERKNSRVWDADFPGTNNSAYGPCVAATNAHCGASFVPSGDYLFWYNEVRPYSNYSPVLPNGFGVSTAFSEGIFTTNSDIPWSIKLSRIIGAIVSAEGVTGHGGPFKGRTKVGISWLCQGKSTIVRFKWA